MLEKKKLCNLLIKTFKKKLAYLWRELFNSRGPTAYEINFFSFIWRNLSIYRSNLDFKKFLRRVNNFKIYILKWNLNISYEKCQTILNYLRCISRMRVQPEEGDPTFYIASKILEIHQNSGLSTYVFRYFSYICL